MRDKMVKAHLIERMVRDIQYLLADDEEIEETEKKDALYLWDDRAGRTDSGVSYGKEQESDSSCIE